MTKKNLTGVFLASGLAVAAAIACGGLLYSVNDLNNSLGKVDLALDKLSASTIRIKAMLEKDTEKFIGLNDECSGPVILKDEQGGYQYRYQEKGEKGIFPVLGGGHYNRTLCLTLDEFNEYADARQRGLADDIYRLEESADTLKNAIARDGANASGDKKLDLAKILRTRNMVLDLSENVETAIHAATTAMKEAREKSAPTFARGNGP